MKFLKLLNYEVICVITAAVIVTFTSFPARMISGERILGSEDRCTPKKCNGQLYVICPDLNEDVDCAQGHTNCIGYNVNKRCHPQTIEVSDCSEDHYRCKNEEDQLCY